MKTTYNGQTVDLITADEISQAVDRIDADWPQGRFLELRRYIRDTLHDCHVLADHYEDADRQRAIDNTYAAASRRLAASIMCPAAVADEQARLAGSLEPLPDRARKAGAA